MRTVATQAQSGSSPQFGRKWVPAGRSMFGDWDMEWPPGILLPLQFHHVGQAPFPVTPTANSTAERRKSAQPVKFCDGIPSQPGILCHYRSTRIAFTRTNRWKERPFCPESHATFETTVKEPEMNSREEPRPGPRQDDQSIPFRFAPA